MKKQTNGLYRTKIMVGRDNNDIPIYKYVSGKTKRALEENKWKAVTAFNYEQQSRTERVFRDYANEWFFVRKKPFLSASSIESYTTTLTKHLFPIFGDRPISSITASEFQSYLNTLTNSSSTKITMIYSCIRSIYASAFQDRIIDFDPATHLIKPKCKKPNAKRCLTSIERERIVEACETLEGGLYLALMFYLGLRPGEARGAKWSDIDWVNKTISIQRDIDYKQKGAAGDLKNSSSYRTIPIPNDLFTLLKRDRFKGTEYIVCAEDGSAISKASCDRLWLSLMDGCSMAYIVKPNAQDIRFRLRAIITPHTLRHNFASMCWENHIDPFTTMHLMGHSSITTTMNIYTHFNDTSLSNVSDELNKIFEYQKLHKSCTSNCISISDTTKKAPKCQLFQDFSNGDPLEIRTPDTLIKSHKK